MADIDKVKKVLQENKMSFEQMIRAYNFWSSLSSEEIDKAIKNYENGKYSNIGMY
jgi:hypothetical protein